MTPRIIFLSLSLLANAGLVVAYLVAPPPPAATVPAQTPASTARPDIPAGPGDGTETSVARPAQPALSWAVIDTPDIDELARRLKAAGFTPNEVRVILSRRIGQLFNPNPTGGDAKSAPYWRPAYRYDPPTSKEGAARRKQMAEQQRLYQKYMMGPEGITDDPERLATAKRRWGDLPVEKLQALAQIEADYQELNMKQYAESRVRPGETGSGDAYRLMEKERLADIAKVLSPEEYAAYELRASPLANSLRYQLETFQPTEEEYKTIFAINKLFEERRSDPKLGLDAFKAMNAEIRAKVGEALGDERALDFDAAVNQNSQDKTAGLVSRLGLPARVATEVRQIQQDFTQRAKDIRANTQLAPNDRSAQLDALAGQAESQLTAKLGSDGFEAYSDVKGDWLRAIQAKGP